MPGRGSALCRRLPASSPISRPLLIVLVLLAPPSPAERWRSTSHEGPREPSSLLGLGIALAATVDHVTYPTTAAAAAAAADSTASNDGIAALNESSTVNIALYIHLYSPVGRSIHNIKRNNKPKNTQNLK